MIKFQAGRKLNYAPGTKVAFHSGADDLVPTDTAYVIAAEMPSSSWTASTR